jgi:hypothetical protein
MNRIIALCGIIIGIILSLFMIEYNNSDSNQSKSITGSGVIGGYDKTIKRKKEKKLIDYVENISYFKNKDYTDAINNTLENPLKNPVLTYNDINRQLPYQSMASFSHQSVHIGQLKLLITEIQFLTNDLVKNKLKNTDKIYFVYVGSAPGHHTSILEELFPNAEFLLVDPNEHCLYYPNNATQYDREHSNKFLYFKVAKGNRFDIQDRRIDCMLDGNIEIIDRNNHTDIYDVNKNFSIQRMKDTLFQENYKFYIFEDYYSNDISKVIDHVMKKLGKRIYFCSDIRSNLENESYPRDLDVVWNTAQQYNWLHNMKNSVHKAMLKFRLPFYTEEDKQHFRRNVHNNIYKYDLNSCLKLGLDFIKNYNNHTFKYYEYETINLQTFPGQTSAESRLVIDGDVIRNNKLIEYSINDYEQKFFYYNNITRLYGFCEHNERYISRKLGLDYCNDCGIIINVLQNYFSNFRKTDNPCEITNYIEHILHVIRRDLRQGSHHGNFFTPYTNVHTILNDQRVLAKVNLYHSNIRIFKNINNKFSTMSDSIIKSMKIYNPYKIKNNLRKILEKYVSVNYINKLYYTILYYYTFKTYSEELFQLLLIEILLLPAWHRGIYTVDIYSKLSKEIIDIKEDSDYKPIKLSKDKDNLVIHTDKEKLNIGSCISKYYDLKPEIFEYNYFELHKKFIKITESDMEKIYNVRKHKHIYEISYTFLNDSIDTMNVMKNTTKNLVLTNISLFNNTLDNKLKLHNIDNIYPYTFTDYNDDCIIYYQNRRSHILNQWWFNTIFPVLVSKLNNFSIIVYLHNDHKSVYNDILNIYHVIHYKYIPYEKKYYIYDCNLTSETDRDWSVLVISKSEVNDYDTISVS